MKEKKMNKKQKTFMSRKQDIPYSYKDCKKLVDNWMKKTNYKIYKINKK